MVSSRSMDVGAFAALLALVVYLAACGGGSNSNLNLSPSQDPSPGAQKALDPVYGGADLSHIIAEIEATEVPAGVQPGVWEDLTDELVRILGLRRINKVVSAPPAGEANRVMDLTLAEATEGGFQLEWTYKNTGDYDYNGEVNLADVAKIALYYQISNAAPEWVDAQHADGDGNGEVNLADIQPIAVNFQADASSYGIAGILLPGGENELLLGTLALSESEGTPPRFTWPLPTIDHALYRVYPIDGFGVDGLRSVDVVTAGDIEISGQVLWDTGGPVEGVTVGVSTPAQPLPVNVASDSNGDFTTQLTVNQLPSRVMVRATYPDPDTNLELTNYVWTEEQTGPGTVTDIKLILPNPAGKEMIIAGSTADRADGSVSIDNLAAEVDRVFAQAYDPDLEPEMFPGEYADSDGLALDSQVFVWVSSLDGAGQMVDNLSSPSTVKIEIAVTQYPELSDVTPENGQIDIPIYDFNYDTGVWDYRGIGYLVDATDTILPEELEGDIISGIYTDPLWAVFEADHFSYWNCDRPYAGGLDVGGVPRDKRQAVGEGAKKAWSIITSDKGNDAFKKWNKAGNPDLKNEIGKENGTNNWSPKDGGVKINYGQYKDSTGTAKNGAWAWYSGRKYTLSGGKWVPSVDNGKKKDINLNSGLLEQRFKMDGTVTEYEKRARRFFLGTLICHEITHMKSLIYGGNINITPAASAGVNCEGYQWTKDLYKGLFTYQDGKLLFRSSDPTNADYNKWKEVTLDDLKNKYCNPESSLYKDSSSFDPRSTSEVGFSGLTLDISTTVTDFGLTDPILLDVTFSNTSADDLVLPEISDSYLNPLIFYIEDEDGDIMPWLDPVEILLRDESTEVTIPPGGSETLEFNLRYFDAEDEQHNYAIYASGTYDIYAYYNQGIPPWDGVTSNTVSINVDVDLPPVVTSVWPVSGEPGDQETFTATTAFPYVDSWAWDFGGAATPNTSTEASPTVTFGAEGLYNASVTATNIVGFGKMDFQLLVADYPPWQMFGGNPSHTRRSTVVAAKTNHIDWSFANSQAGGYNFIPSSSPAIGVDGTAYIGDRFGVLHAINPDGSALWEYATGDDIVCSPAIDLDGTVYVGSHDGNLYALNPDGTEKWVHPTGDRIQSSPTIGPDRTIYLGSDDNYFYAINPDSSLQWRYDTGAKVKSSPAISANGTIYFGNENNYITALNPDGTLQWEFREYDNFVMRSSPALGTDGTVYIGSASAWGVHCLYAINPDGTLGWRYEVDQTVTSPAVGSDGTIYFALENNNANPSPLYAINPDGTLKWSRELGMGFVASPTLGADDTIYIGEYVNSNQPSTMYALDPDGTTLWTYPLHDSVRTSAAIDDLGRVYVADEDRLVVFSGTTPEDQVAPVVTGVTPLTGRPNSNLVFWASTHFENVDSWSWDFGGAATPNTSTDASPVVTLVAGESVYDATVTATNGAGSDVFNFQVTVGQFPQWRMSGYGETRTGRSPYVGPQTSTEAWVFPLRNVSNYGGSVAISADGTIYADGSYDGTFAINPDGTLLWNVDFAIESGTYTSGPTIGLDGSVYIGLSHYLYARNPDLTEIWTSVISSHNVFSNPVYDSDGTLYMIHNDDFVGFNPDGSEKWRIPWGDIGYFTFYPPIAPDGTIYVASAYGADKLTALNPNGVLKWVYPSLNDIARVSLGYDGTIYVYGRNPEGLAALDPNGEERWFYPANITRYRTPAVAGDGTIILGTQDDKVEAINPDGTLKWTFGIPSCDSSPVVDPDGTVYVGAGNNWIFAINEDGTVKWSYNAGQLVSRIPAIGENGMLYVRRNDGDIICIGP